MSDFSPGKFFSLSSEERKAELERLVQAGRAEDLIQLKQKAPDRASARPISQALHRLRSRGVKVEEPGDQRTFVLAVEKEQEQFWTTGVDGLGQRLLWVFRPTSEGGVIFNILIGSPQGLKEFIVNEGTAKRFARILREVRKKPDIPIVEVSGEFGLRLIYQAAALGRKNGFPPSEEYTKAKALLGPEPDLSAAHPLLSAFPAEDVRGKVSLAYESARLLRHKLFLGWFFSDDSVKKCALRLEEADLSPLVMAEGQKRERLEQIVKEAAREALTVPERSAWKERLFENAYLLHLLGERELCEIGLATALALEDPESLPPLFPAMMRRAFRWAEKEEEEKEESKKPESRLIIP